MSVKLILRATFCVSVASSAVFMGSAFVLAQGASGDEPGRLPKGAREVSARVLPVPDTVSPQMQAIIARPRRLDVDRVPKSAEEWIDIVSRSTKSALAELPKLREALHVRVEPTTIGGVNAFIVTPEVIASANRDRVLLHFHGGIRVFNPGEAGTREAIMMAALGQFRVISVDYRMPPDFPYPAAQDDALAAYRALLKTTDAKRISVFGVSAGGSLTLSMLSVPRN